MTQEVHEEYVQRDIPFLMFEAGCFYTIDNLCSLQIGYVRLQLMIVCYFLIKLQYFLFLFRV